MTAGTDRSSELAAAIAPGTRLIVDTSVILAHMDGRERASGMATAVIDGFVNHGRNEAIISTVTANEVLVRPHCAGAAREVALTLLDMPGFKVRSVDVLVAGEAARIMAFSSLDLADALILATGILTSSGCLVTNDTALARAVPSIVPEMRVCLLSDFV